MDRTCPHCQNKLVLMSNCAFLECETSTGLSNVITECCGKVVSVERFITFDVSKITIEPNEHGMIVDSWGNRTRAVESEPELHVEGGQIWINQSGYHHLMTGRWFEEGVYYCLISLGTGKYHCIWTDSGGMQGLLKNEKWRLKK